MSIFKEISEVSKYFKIAKNAPEITFYSESALYYQYYRGTGVKSFFSVLFDSWYLFLVSIFSGIVHLNSHYFILANYLNIAKNPQEMRAFINGVPRKRFERMTHSLEGCCYSSNPLREFP